MSIQAITTKVISTLGNKESLIPIMIKDGVDSTSLTLKSFKEGGPIEGMDRAIDEYGTQAIWIGGIPFFKKLIDKTAYKIAKINPNIDPRIIANDEYAKWAKDNAKGIIDKSGQTVKDALEDSLKDGGKLAKNLYTGKIIAATALTLGTFFTLTKLKQKNTKNKAISELQTVKYHDTYTKLSKSEVFSEFEQNNKQNNKPSFKGLGKNVIEGIMFNPVHNMKIIDAGITAERIGCSRNKTEFMEHTIKEGAFLFFIYKFGNMIEDGINKLSENMFKKPIDLKIDVIMDENLKNALNAGTIADDLAKIPEASKSLTEKLDFIINNPDNIFVKAAKKADIVKCVKDKAGNSVVDTSKFIDTNDLETLAKNLKNIDDKFKMSDDCIDTFLNKTKALKVTSVMANIGISCFILGYLIPKAVYKYREWKTGTTKFHVVEDIKNEKKKDI